MVNAQHIVGGLGAAIGAAIALAVLLAPDPIDPGGGDPTRIDATSTAAAPLAGLGRPRPEASAPPPHEDVPPATPPDDSRVGGQEGRVPVTLRLRRTDGQPVDRASLRVQGEEGHVLPWDPATGLVALPVGRLPIEVLGGRFGEWRQPEDLEIDVRPGMAPVEVTLRPWRMIVGHLRPAAGSPAVPAAARLRTVDAARLGIDEVNESCAVALDPPGDGWFCFGKDHELEPGMYDVSALPWRFGPVRSSIRVTISDGPATVELDLPRAERSDGVVLEVLGPAGEPHEPDLITIDVRDARGGGGGGRTASEKLGDGLYWIPTLLPGYSSLDPVAVTLGVWSTTYGERRVDVAVGRPGPPVVVRYDAPAEVRVVVANLPEPLKGALEVQARVPVANGQRRLASAPLSEAGVALLRGLQPGPVHLLLASRADPRELLYLGLGRHVLGSGENRIEVTYPLLHPLRVGGIHVWLDIHATDGSGTRGSYVLGSSDHREVSVPAGVYELRSGARTATVEIPSVTEVTFVEPQPR